MMPSIRTAERINLAYLDKHVYMSDLIYVEGPLLCLYRDAKENWLYLWCDTDNKNKERWLLFPITRTNLIAFLEKQKSLLDVVNEAKKRWFLDYAQLLPNQQVEKVAENAKTFSRELRNAENLEVLKEYLPTKDSYFDETLAPNISIAEELSPTKYDVPIDGNWFIKDLDNFSNLYSQLYAFFYCTKPQFMTDIGSKVRRMLEAPWKGGFSRVNLFEALQRNVPAVHDLKIHQMQYASPGDITIEALESVGDSVKNAVIYYRKNVDDVSAEVKSLNNVLSDKALRRVDLSKYSTSTLPLPDQDKTYIAEKTASLAAALAIEAEFTDLSSRSPNIVVSAKVLLAVASRIERMAQFQDSGLLDLERQPKQGEVP